MNFHRFMNALMVCILVCLSSSSTYSKESLSSTSTELPTREDIDRRYKDMRDNFGPSLASDSDCYNVNINGVLASYEKLRVLFKDENYKENLNKTLEFLEEGYELAQRYSYCNIYNHNLLWRFTLDPYIYYSFNLNLPENEHEEGPKLVPLPENVRSSMYYWIYDRASSLYYACLYSGGKCSNNRKIEDLLNYLNNNIEFMSKDNLSYSDALFIFSGFLIKVGGIYPYSFEKEIRDILLNIGDYSLNQVKYLRYNVYGQTDNPSVLEESSQLIANAIVEENDPFSRCTENLASLLSRVHYYRPPTLYNLAYVDHLFFEQAMRSAYWYYSYDDGNCKNNSIRPLVLNISSKIRNKVKEKLSEN